MMKFHIINVEEWTRKPYYEHYLRSNKCTFSITVDIDITRLLYSLKLMDSSFIQLLFIWLQELSMTGLNSKLPLVPKGNWVTGIG